MNQLLRIIFLLLIGNAAMAAEVVNFNIAERSCVAHGKSSWGYYGQLSWHPEGDTKKILLPNDWGHRYEACGRALAHLHRQSPIELPAPDNLTSGETGEVVFADFSGTRPVRVEHNCHTVQATFERPDTYPDEGLRISGQLYRLLQFHVHTPSEHVIHTGEDGSINYPGEIHFVHAAVKSDGTLDSGRLAVVGVFIDLSDEHADPVADSFFMTLARDYRGRQTSPQDNDPIDIDLGRFKGHTRDYWRYAGSLTTPPCSETVEWVVLEKPLTLSLATFRRIQEDKLDVGFANTRPPFLPTSHHRLRFTRP